MDMSLFEEIKRLSELGLTEEVLDSRICGAVAAHLLKKRRVLNEQIQKIKKYGYEENSKLEHEKLRLERELPGKAIN